MYNPQIDKLPWGGFLITMNGLGIIISHSNHKSRIVVCGLGSFQTSIEAPPKLDKLSKQELIDLAKKAIEDYKSFIEKHQLNKLKVI